MKMSALEGYRKEIELIRETEFPQLKGCTYVEHVGTTLFAKSQMEAYQKELLGNLYGNPHSRGPSSTLSSDVTDQVRYRILRHFNTSQDEYSVIFTQNCTGALRLIAENFTFDPGLCRGRTAGNIGSRTTLVGHPKDNEAESDAVKTRDCDRGDDVKSERICGCFCYTLDNHTSVQGMRGAVKDRVGTIICLDEQDLETEEVPESKVIYQHPHVQQGGNCLFAYPAQSNYSGRKYPLSWVQRLRQHAFPFQRHFQGKWFSVLDAAAFVSTSVLDLRVHKPDFVTLSFYKMMGFPTSIGCLLVRNEVGDLLQKKYFGGGSVTASSATDMYAEFRDNLSDRFEDGTIPFLEILALRHGFDALEKIGGGMRVISDHTFSVGRYFYHHLMGLTHGNGRALAVIYCQSDFSDITSQGAVVNFNLKRANGEYIGFAEVDKMAQLYNIHLRTGCFCNIGACQKYLALTSEQIKDNFQAGHVCGDDKDLINGEPTGSVRISFGYMSMLQDAQNCLRFITDCFLENVTEKPNFLTLNLPSLMTEKAGHETEALISNMCDKNPVNNICDSVRDGEIEAVSKKLQNSKLHFVYDGSLSDEDIQPNSVAMETDLAVRSCEEDTRRLTDICLYPVKSCAGFKVSSWVIGHTGLLYDRRWMVVSNQGVAVSQKREPLMCLIKPVIDLNSQTLRLSYRDHAPLIVPLDVTQQEISISSLSCSSKVCGDRVQGLDCGDQAADWLSRVLNRPGCRLIQQDLSSNRQCKLRDTEGGGDVKHHGTGDHQGISLANESQYLLVSRESVRLLKDKILDSGQSKLDGSEDIKMDNLISRFRGNLVIGGGRALEEDSWSELQIGSHVFTSQGGCSRCQMVCLDQKTGSRSKEPLRTLAAWRGRKIPFGIHLRNSLIQEGTQLCVGDPVHVIHTVVT